MDHDQTPQNTSLIAGVYWQIGISVGKTLPQTKVTLFADDFILGYFIYLFIYFSLKTRCRFS